MSATETTTTERAFDRLLEKMQQRLERAELECAGDVDGTTLASWNRGFRAAAKLAVEDAELMRQLARDLEDEPTSCPRCGSSGAGGKCASWCPQTPAEAEAERRSS